MRVVHLSTNDIRGGAARAAYRLHRGLCRQGIESLMFVGQKESDDPTVSSFVPSMHLKSRFCRVLRRFRLDVDFSAYRTSRPGSSEFFSDDRSEHGYDLWHQIPHVDLIHLHWVAGFVDYYGFFRRMPRQVSIVWTLHDMNPFTGGCHYDQGCGRFKSGCGTCPQLGSNDPADLSHRIWQRKRKALAHIHPSRLHIVSSSRWLAGAVAASSLLGRFPGLVIPHGLDTADFAPRDRSVARAALEVADDARIVMFAAGRVTEHRKGFELLAQAMSRLPEKSGLFLMSLGRGRPVVDSGLRQIHLGHIENDRLLSLAFSAADVFVIPSTQEAFGQTALESMACGTPVVGFAVGGIPDVIQTGVCGLLVPPGNVEALADAINRLLGNEDVRVEMSANGRQIAVEAYALEVQARRYIDLYEQLVSKQ
jgi:glycosyltransferase involved in cell wall biosynthesis